MFKINASGTFTVLHTFIKDDNSGRPNRVTLASDGTLYGTTTGTGNLGGTYGTVYKISSEGVYSILHNFDLVNGGTPLSGIALGRDGSLYGATRVWHLWLPLRNNLQN
ncbi:MAG: choice-of-anchor tandem repeat GloVer-containing protein [Methyloglobulus sp.]|nr:hypothetical protein [Methyloglobulus sp.]